MEDQVVKLSQREALLIELLRGEGVADDQILASARSGEIEAYQQLGGGHFDFNELVEFAKTHGELLKQAIRQGYEIKFNTINGIKLLVGFMFGQEAEREGERLEGLALSPEDLSRLRRVLSRFWAVTEMGPTEDGRISVRIELPAGS
ncbi:hypothetical protein [Paenibacillus cremeus]|uniref:Uncharacterized protein n=1 Tax=Paenibacillus cremeus TaxID=2163881 RepID=A0A559KBJ4_9BACL|nr:hypothetical protein [Paenibacillus cremeus]TVY09504.1 hypothetical protein FPZ49_13785 [Paenibacillus cremeus]